MSHDTADRTTRRGTYALVLGCGLLLVAWSVTLALVSPIYGHGQTPSAPLMSMLVGLNVAAGVVFLVAVWLGRRIAPTRPVLIGLVLVGAGMRIAQLPAVPILEDDFYRYLWDGAVAASGHNPYAHAPLEIQQALAGEATVPAELVELGRDSAVVLERINHPDLRTIYPPVAQATFAAAYLLKPWSLAAWRVVLLCFELATLVLLWRLLASVDRPATWAAIYWWHPTVVQSLVNGCHMDAIVLPFVVLALWLAVRSRLLGSVVSLALAAGAKLWPVLLLPVLFRGRGRGRAGGWGRLIAALCVFALLAALLAFPIIATGLDSATGFRAYARTWHNNQLHFWLLTKGCELGSRVVRLDQAHGQLLARGIVVCLMAAWVAWLARRPAESPRDLARRAMLVVAGLYLLSPTQFPWYYCWLVPLLAVSPWWPLLAYVAVLPLYHLHYAYPAVVVAEHLPVWCLIGYDLFVRRRRAPRSVEVLP